MSFMIGVFGVLYYLAFLLYFRWILPAENKRIWLLVPALCMIAGAYYVLRMIGLPWLNLPVLMVIVAFGIYFCTGLTPAQAVCGAGISILNLYCFRGVTTAVGAWIVHDTIPGFALDTNSYYGLTVLSMVIALAFLHLLRKTLLPDKDLRMFFDNPASLKNVIAYELAAIPFLEILNQGRYHDPDAVWYTGITLSGSGFTLIMLMYLIYRSIKETGLLKYKLSNRFLEEQMELQLRYYKSYHKSTEKFRRLRHDYLSVVRAMEAMLEAGRYEQALEMVREAHETIEETRFSRKAYSENPTLNAVLQDLAFNCEEHGIRMTCQVAVPRNTELTVLEALRIITNITTNAVEACKKVPKEERFIQLSGCNENGWAVLNVVNAFDGSILLEEGRLKSTKVQAGNHGMGLSIIKDIAESKGGMVLFDADLSKKTFETRVHIPQCNREKKE